MKVMQLKTFATAALAAGALLVSALPAVAASPSAGAAQANRALAIRSEALNQKYGLGSTRPAQVAGTAQEAKRALELRGEGLNRRFGLGTYATVVRPDNGFDWAAAGLGAAVMLGIGLVAGGLVLVARHSRRPGAGEVQPG